MYKMMHVGCDVMLAGRSSLHNVLSSPSTSYVQLGLIFAVGITVHILKYVSILVYIWCGKGNVKYDAREYSCRTATAFPVYGLINHILIIKLERA
jgi:hypothetical protein